MIPDSRTLLHIGINFVLAPAPDVSKDSALKFHRALDEEMVEFNKFDQDVEKQRIAVVSEKPSRFEINVGSFGPPHVGQIVMRCPQPDISLERFVRTAESVLKAFHAVWPAKKQQLVACDATIRDLYQTTSEHSFKEIWEDFLGQEESKLAKLGRKVLGGGLRFVMPPQQGDKPPVQVEVKVESFLRDSGKVFVETQFTWPQPMPRGKGLDPAARLKILDDYTGKNVIDFMTGDA